MTSSPYCGRFAPSPTGALHFGSLVAALASYLEAKAHNGLWRVRMEDLDPPREVAGAADDILRTLEAFGFEWDGPVEYQSKRGGVYRDVVEDLLKDELAYYCQCSRSEIAHTAVLGPEGPIYPGTCRHDSPCPRHKGRAIRLMTHSEIIAFEDAVQGPIKQSVEQEIGDFVIRRADGLFAYQLAVVLDDAWQNITHIVRGADLLLSTPRQIHLQSVLGLPSPQYAHIPLVLNADGKKLSKQSRSLPVDPKDPLPALLAAMRFLGHPQPDEKPSDRDEFWQWAIKNWNLARIPRQLD